MKTLECVILNGKAYVKRTDFEEALKEGFKYFFVGWNSVTVNTEEEHNKFLEQAWADKVEDIKENEEKEEWDYFLSEEQKEMFLSEYDDYGDISEYLKFPVDDEESNEYIFNLYC